MFCFSNYLFIQGEVIWGSYIEKNIQEVSYKCLIFKKLFLKAQSAKPKCSGNSTIIMCLLKVSSPNQNSINYMNNEVISIWKGIIWIEIHTGTFQNLVTSLASKPSHYNLKCYVILGTHFYFSWVFILAILFSPRCLSYVICSLLVL